jgi:hypothetical protein
VAKEQDASVTAQRPGGHAVHGVMVSGRGFPYKVWAVRYPSADDAQIVFRDAGGHAVGHLALAGNPPFPARPRSGGIAVFRYPADSRHAKPGWMIAYLMGGKTGPWAGKVGFWSSDGMDSVISAARASGPPAVGLVGAGEYTAGAKQAEFYGYAHQNVARVVLRLGHGTQYGTRTFAAWPGSGLRLWAFPVPVSAFGTAVRGAVTVQGYDAADHLLWQERLGG